MAKTEAQKRATRKYDAAHYWSPTLYIPKELEAEVRKKSNGSINGYIVSLIKKDLGIVDTVDENKKGTP